MKLTFFCNFFQEAELLRLELLHSDKVPEHANDESQQGEAVNTRSMKKDLRVGRWTWNLWKTNHVRLREN